MTPLDALRALVDALPRCCGRWLERTNDDESGYVWRGDEGCAELATHFQINGEDDSDCYCPKHAAEIGFAGEYGADEWFGRCTPLEKARVPIDALRVLAGTSK